MQGQVSATSLQKRQGWVTQENQDRVEIELGSASLEDSGLAQKMSRIVEGRYLNFDYSSTILDFSSRKVLYSGSLTSLPLGIFLTIAGLNMIEFSGSRCYYGYQGCQQTFQYGLINTVIGGGLIFAGGYLLHKGGKSPEQRFMEKIVSYAEGKAQELLKDPIVKKSHVLAKELHILARGRFEEIKQETNAKIKSISQTDITQRNAVLSEIFYKTQADLEKAVDDLRAALTHAPVKKDN